MNELQELLSLCKNSVSIEVNRHRDYHESVESYLTSRGVLDRDSIVAEMIRRDTVVEVQAYPRTAISFHLVFHWDAIEAIRQTINAIRKDEVVK